LLLPIALVALNLFASQAFAQKRKDILATFVPLSLNLTADSTVVSTCAVGDQQPQVRLNARAISPSGSPLREAINRAVLHTIYSATWKATVQRYMAAGE